MKLNKSIILTGTALAGFFIAGGAWAQSTGTQSVEDAQEVLITGTRGAKSVNGLAVKQTVTKTRSSIDEQYIETQPAGQSILNSINLLPGVHFTNNDASGTAGGDITLRGFDAQRVSLTLDGMPLNDTGNYQIYSNQMVDPELMSRVDVNLGTTDVDSPTAAASGGTINLTTAKPKADFGVQFKGTLGGNEYERGFLRIDSGAFGPWGTTAYLAISNQSNEAFVGHGDLNKIQYDARIYQPLSNGDFVSVSAHWNKNRNNFIQRVTLAQFDAHQNGVPSTVLQPCTKPWTCASTSYYDYSINPSNTGNIRAQGKFHLTDNLILTVDPSFQFVMANGGGTQTLSEKDKRVIGASGGTGFDLNGDGDTNDTVRFYAPSNTKTHRFVLTSSLIWRINETNTIRGAYTVDYGRHRQTGEYSYLSDSGEVVDVFSSRKGEGKARPALAADGAQLQRRNRASIAKLEQFALSYNGAFLDNALKVDIGVRAPKLTRNLNNFCYQQNTFNAYCTTSPTGQADAGSSGGVAALAPVSFTKEFSRVLPNVGVSYNFTGNHTAYASYASSISAPRTDDLYDSKIPTIKPEIGNTVDLGYRYSSSVVSGSLAVWSTDFSHRIERAYDEELGFSTSTDIGDVKMSGINAEIGVRPIDNLSLYASASMTDSEILSDVPTSSTAVAKTKGNKLNKYPESTASLRADYDLGAWSFGLQGKYTGERFTTLMNTEKAPSYTVADADVRYTFKDTGALKNLYLQLNVYNLGDTRYLGTISVNDPFATAGQLFQQGAPQTVFLSINAEF